MNYIKGFRETFPELNHLTTEELCDRWIDLKIELFREIKTPVRPWIRFTLPFALIIMLLMFISLPFIFVIKGEWGYSNTDNSPIFNWFRELRLIS